MKFIFFLLLVSLKNQSLISEKCKTPCVVVCCFVAVVVVSCGKLVRHRTPEGEKYSAEIPAISP